MLPEPSLLRRSPYLIPPATELEHSVRTHYEDWEHYHLPLANLHHAYLHDWGVAGGLEVLVNPQNQNEIEVRPGVAIDGAGKLIALSSSGLADVGGDQPIGTPFRLSTQGLANALRYLVIQFGERLNFNEQKHEQLPVLRLVATSGEESYVDDGSIIILAVVQTDAAGAAIVWPYGMGELAYGRRLLGSHAQQLELRRPALSATGVVETAVAGRVAAHGSGLRITVFGADDSVRLAREDGGDFNQLAVNARQTGLQGNLHVSGATSLTGNVGIGIAAPLAKLQVIHEPQDASGNTLVLGPTAGSNLRLGYHNDYSWIQSYGTRPLALNPLSNNVGIGTTVPAAKLDVNGDLRLLNGVAVNEFSSDNTLAGNSHNAVPTVRAIKEYIDNLLVGSVAAFATPTPPAGWLECNGQVIGRTQYARLFARIGTTFGAGDGSSTFNVPDLRGVMARGWDHGRGMDSGRSFGSYQGDTFENHTHSFSGSYDTISGGWHQHVDHSGGFWSSVKLPGGGTFAIRRHNEGDKTWGESHTHGYVPRGSISYATTGRPAGETRTKNVALMYCIKF